MNKWKKKQEQEEEVGDGRERRSVGMNEKNERTDPADLFSYISNTCLAFEIGNGLWRFSFSNKSQSDPTTRAEQEVSTQKFWCTFPPSPSFVLLRFPSFPFIRTHLNFRFSPIPPPFPPHRHRHILSHAVIARLCVSVCISFHLFILPYLSGAKVFLFICCYIRIVL